MQSPQLVGSVIAIVANILYLCTLYDGNQRVRQKFKGHRACQAVVRRGISESRAIAVRRIAIVTRKSRYQIPRILR